MEKNLILNNEKLRRLMEVFVYYYFEKHLKRNLRQNKKGKGTEEDFIIFIYHLGRALDLKPTNAYSKTLIKITPPIFAEQYLFAHFFNVGILKMDGLFKNYKRNVYELEIKENNKNDFLEEFAKSIKRPTLTNKELVDMMRLSLDVNKLFNKKTTFSLKNVEKLMKNLNINF